MDLLQSLIYNYRSCCVAADDAMSWNLLLLQYRDMFMCMKWTFAIIRFDGQRYDTPILSLEHSWSQESR